MKKIAYCFDMLYKDELYFRSDQEVTSNIPNYTIDTMQEGLDTLLGQEALVVELTPTNSIGETTLDAYATRATELIVSDPRIIGRLVSRRSIAFDSALMTHTEFWHVDPYAGIVIHKTEEGGGRAAFTTHIAQSDLDSDMTYYTTRAVEKAFSAKNNVLLVPGINLRHRLASGIVLIHGLSHLIHESRLRRLLPILQ